MHQAVHPRACGEHVRTCDAAIRQCGSSPRVRGTLDAVTSRVVRISVHPRACGEHVGIVRCRRRRCTGSSPRVRGTRCRCDGDSHGRRFIPARAGNTQVSDFHRRITSTVHPRACGEHPTPSLPRRRAAVHPRACGEHVADLGGDSLHIGSSPRVRGTLADVCQAIVLMSVHPRACGEHSRLGDSADRAAVHPRACGEHDVGAVP